MVIRRRTTIVEEVDEPTSTKPVGERASTFASERTQLVKPDETGRALRDDRSESEARVPDAAPPHLPRGRTAADVIAELLSSDRNVAVGLYVLATFVMISRISQISDLVYPLVFGTFLIFLWKFWPFAAAWIARKRPPT